MSERKCDGDISQFFFGGGGAASEEEKWVESILEMSSSQMIRECSSTRDESVFPDI